MVCPDRRYFLETLVTHSLKSLGMAIALATACMVVFDAAAADTRKLAAGETFKDCDDCPEMVVIPAGSFMMGSPAREVSPLSFEKPQHGVEFSQPFAMAKYEVTFAEWDACVSDGGCSHRPEDEGWGRGRRPVINVSWDDAKEYVSWLSRRTGENYRLPSEAEWEYAARAGTSTQFHTGDQITTSQANFNGNYTYGGSSKGEFRAQTVPVGGFDPNSFGLHDIHGNVWEWLEDCANKSYGDAPTDGSAWIAGDCKRRGVRGGSWFNDPGALRSANRFRMKTSSRYHDVGIRLARTFTP